MSSCSTLTELPQSFYCSPFIMRNVSTCDLWLTYEQHVVFWITKCTQRLTSLTSIMQAAVELFLCFTWNILKFFHQSFLHLANIATSKITIIMIGMVTMTMTSSCPWYKPWQWPLDIFAIASFFTALLATELTGQWTGTSVTVE